jgi:hypothetical protein
LGTLLSFAPLLYFLRLQLPFIVKAHGGNWIDTTELEAIRSLAAMPGHTVGDNIVVAVAVAVVLYALFRRSRAPVAASREQVQSIVPSPSEQAYAAALAAGLAFAAVVLAGINLVRPVVIPRYLIAMTPIAAAIVSALAYRALLSRTLFVALLYANAAALVLIYSLKPMTEKRWETAIGYMTDRSQKCPASRIYALDPNLLSVGPPPGRSDVHDWGYQLEARLHGLQAQVISAETPGPLTFAAHCPTLFWAEHVDLDLASGDVRKSAFAHLREMQQVLPKATIFRDDEGLVIEVPANAD